MSVAVSVRVTIIDVVIVLTAVTTDTVVMVAVTAVTATVIAVTVTSVVTAGSGVDEAAQYVQSLNHATNSEGFVIQ